MRFTASRRNRRSATPKCCVSSALALFCENYIPERSQDTSMRENRNIYQSARELKGLTQEVAAERLDISVESLGAYEQGRRRPPDSTVLRMAQIYDFPYLCYQHIQSGDLAGVMPEVNVKSLEHAAMRIVRLIGGFARDGQFDQLLQICEDGVIAEEERPAFDCITSELGEIVSAALELTYASKGVKK
ncbi:XRE family transcriptional regulator [Butyricicoccus sp. AM42-5AC]|nr:XRE family transcriptional regulator [Butyricicoccus sp. AM42-5AC]